MTNDYAIVADVRKGTLVLHRTGCSEVQKARLLGKPILSLFQCANAPREDAFKHERHECLEPAEAVPSAAK